MPSVPACLTLSRPASDVPIRAVARVGPTRATLTLEDGGGIVTYSADGKRIASAPGTPGRVEVWNAQTDRELLSLNGHTRGGPERGLQPGRQTPGQRFA